MRTHDCAAPGCPGHVYDESHNIPAMTVLADSPMYEDGDVIYLLCDGPDEHWKRYHLGGAGWIEVKAAPRNDPGGNPPINDTEATKR